MSPFLVVLIGVVFVIVAIAKLKIHPFFALILAALLVGILSPVPLDSLKPLKEGEVAPPHATLVLQHTAMHFGVLAGKIGIVIVLAAVIGLALMESGAADKITRRLLALLGEKRANYALLGSGYILSVPVFFDTVFYLLVPLARALRMRTGRNFLLYIMAICAGGVVTHSLVPPTPGPLIMVEALGLDLGQAILGGFLLGLPPALLGGILLPRFLSRRIDPPIRDVAGSSTEELEAIVNKPESELPGFFVSILPVILPVVLITVHSIVGAIQKASETPESYAWLFAVTSFLGDKLFALGLGTALALWLMARQKGYSLKKLTQSLEPALMSAGIIILITCAGGSFGSMLKSIGLEEAIKPLIEDNEKTGLVFILIAWGISVVMKVAQGSGTVAMITASSIMAGIVGPDTALGYHMIYIFGAIAFGSMVVSWMNDSGFWVVCKMSGFTEEETLKTWTVMLGVMGVVGLVEVLVLAWLLPLAG
jgi:GntP family gluconate:H+ symporter